MKHFFSGSKKGEKGSKGKENDYSLTLQRSLQSTDALDFSDCANPWKADKFFTFICDNNEDNVPIEKLLRKKDREEYTFIVSQSRGGNKVMGQDSMSIAKHKDWEVLVLCDGHDEQGHLMSQGVSSVLPHILLRLIHARFPEELDDPVDEDLIYDAFDECENVVCWAPGDVRQGDYVRFMAEEYEGIHGYVTGFDANGDAIVSVIEEVEFENPERQEGEEPGEEAAVFDVGYVELAVPATELLLPRFLGGCTCVALIRNIKTNECKLATSGDSRCLFYVPNPTKAVTSETNKFIVENRLALNDPALKAIYGRKLNPRTKKPYLAFLTPQHNVFNLDELGRLNADYPNAFTLNGAFLVNPETNFMIQPTRGFGDHDMHGTGYTHIPEITGTFILPENSMIFCASDGVFDENVWADDEIVDRIGELYSSNETTNEIARIIYEETLDRSLVGGYVDDISIFSYAIPSTATSPLITEQKKSVVSADGGVTAVVTDNVADENEMEVRQSMDFLKKGSSKASMASMLNLKLKKEVSHGEKSERGLGDPSRDKRRTLKRNSNKNLPGVVEDILGKGMVGTKTLRKPSNKEAGIPARFKPHPPSHPKPTASSPRLDNTDVDPETDNARKPKANQPIPLKKDQVKKKVKKGGKTLFKMIGRGKGGAKSD